MLENLGDLVVKGVHGSGGYGMLIGPRSTKKEIEAFRAKRSRRPGGYIAQPTLALSTVPTFVEEGIEQRHVDLRPYCLVGKGIELVPGGAHAGGAEEGVARRELVAGRRGQGHLGDGGLSMLSRTAENLFWIARYIERAETTARLLEVGARNALIPNTSGGFRSEWDSVLRAAARPTPLPRSTASRCSATSRASCSSTGRTPPPSPPASSGRGRTGGSCARR